MGNVSSAIFGVGNRPRQGRAVLEIGALIYLARRIQQWSEERKKQLESEVEGKDGRRPSITTIATQNGTSTPAASAATTSEGVSSIFQRWNEALKKYEPLQLILHVLIAIHITNNLSLLLGLNAPHISLTQEPDMHYSPTFASIRWLLTGLDAATLSVLKVKIPIFKHSIWVILSIYYLINRIAAENKVNAFRRSMTHEAVRSCWEKGTNPILAMVDRIMRKRCNIDLELIEIPSPDGHKIECRLFYSKDRIALQNETRLLLDLPGGGFIAMSPHHHAEYLSHWAHTLGVPILSVNYRKAPQFPFPCGLEDAWYVYKAIVDTNGSIVGINSGLNASISPIKLAVVGDSAGGNLTAGVTIKAIMEKYRVPDGIHMIYPVLDFCGEIWKSTSLPPPNHRVKAREHKPKRRVVQPTPQDSSAPSAAYHSDPTPTPATSTDIISSSLANSYSLVFPPPLTSPALTSSLSPSTDSGDVRHLPSPPTDSLGVPQLSSRTMYAFDGVLPFKYMLLLADCYFKNGGDPVNNPFASPMAVSDTILAQFPPVYAHVGSVDPLVDDMVKFARRCQIAKPTNDVYLCIIPKVSHAYLHVTNFLPEAKCAVDLSAMWIGRILDLPHDDMVSIEEKLKVGQKLRDCKLSVINFKGIAQQQEKSLKEDQAKIVEQASSPSSSQLPLPAKL